jgi:endonuclease/exonuclease/phosphatase family metal-dependent hydrolase
MTNNEPVPSDPALYAANLEKAVDLIRSANPDIIGFQEIDFGAERSIGVQQLDTLAQRLNYPAGAQAVNWDVRYLPFPYGAPSVHYGQTLSGQAILSRFPVADHQRYVLAETSRPYLSRVFYLDRLAQVADIVIGRDTLSVVNVHLEAFEQPVRLTQAGEVRELLAGLVATDRPVLLIGDFNAVPDAADDATLNIVTQDLPFERAVPSSSDAQALATYPGDAPTRLIDHIFYMPAFMRPLDTSISCGANPDPPSDHCAVTTRFLMARDTTASEPVGPKPTE